MKYDICTLYIATVTKLCHFTNHYHLVRLYDDTSTTELAAVSSWYRNKVLFNAFYLYGLALT